MPKAWISRAIGHPSNLRPFRNDVGERDHERLVEIQRMVERGERLKPEDFPKEVFGAPNARDHHYRPPHLFFGYGYWIVSLAAADVLRQFDLGNGVLNPVQVLKNDRQTPIDGEWFCLSVGNQKSALVPDLSQNIRAGPQGRYNASAILADEELALSNAAVEGPDIWIDTQLWDAVFLSEELGNALRKAKADKGFMLLKCRAADD